MDEKQGNQKESTLDRRKFLGALGAAAAAGVFLERGGGSGAKGATTAPTYYYKNSLGIVAPVAPDTAALGILPPLVPAPPGASQQTAGEFCLVSPPACIVENTAPSAGYPQYNILMIMVDQMRNPSFWPPNNPTGLTGEAAINAVIPNIVGLMNQSYVFPNFYVCASPCTPSRSNFLTGLYSQQTCMFVNEGGSGAASLQPYVAANNTGFPTIGNVLSQSLLGGGYDCTWIGKWHVSCFDGNAGDGTPGANGPSEYGFNDLWSLPTGTSNPLSYNTTYPSPNGVCNEGNGGDFLDSAPANHSSIPNFPVTLTKKEMSPVAGLLQLNDAAIAYAFNNDWVPHAVAAPPSGLGGGVGNPGGIPWFAAVSFVNPHDIAHFPYAYGLTLTQPATFYPPGGTPDTTGYQPPDPTTTQATSYTG